MLRKGTSAAIAPLRVYADGSRIFELPQYLAIVPFGTGVSTLCVPSIRLMLNDLPGDVGEQAHPGILKGWPSEHSIGTDASASEFPSNGAPSSFVKSVGSGCLSNLE